MNRIALDLEFEQPNRGTEITDSYAEKPEIIQVGWVVFDDETFTVHTTEKHHVYYPHPISEFIKNLTKIKDEDVLNGHPLDDVYALLINDLNEYKCCRIVLQWGHGDVEAIKRDMPTYEGEPKWELGRSGYNVKHLYQTYAEAVGLNRSGGLSKTCKRLGLEWKGRGKHQADVDALNTAQVYYYLFNKMKLLKGIS